MNRRHRAGLVVTLALAVSAFASGACLQVAGLNGFDDDGASASATGTTDGGFDGSIMAKSDASPAPDAAKGPECSAADPTCPSGTVCDTTAQACADNPKCSNLESETCAIYPQCDCDQGLSCTPNRGRRGNQCVSAGDTPRGGACDIASSTSTCELGLGCFDDLCLAFCDPDNPATSGCAAGETCSTVSHDPVFAVCVPSCNPLSDDCSSNCDFLADLNQVPVCVTAGTAFAGGSCDPTSASPAVHCAPSLVCGPTSTCVTPVASQADCVSGATWMRIYGLGFGYCE